MGTRVKVLGLALMVAQVVPAAGAAEVGRISDADGDFSKQYTTLTKKVLLAGIEIERFSLNSRLDNGVPPRWRKWRFFATQEAGASCGLAFEIAGIEQFGIGQHRPLKVNTTTLSHALTTAMTGSAIAAGGSAFELGASVYRASKSHGRGNNPLAADRFVAKQLKTIDALLSERSALVAAHSDDPSYRRALAEGTALQEMRNNFVREYSMFDSDIAKFNAFQNSFYLLNASYNTVGAVAAGLAKRALVRPKYNGPANIMFIISGGLATVTPMLATGCALLYRRHAERMLTAELGGKQPPFDRAKFAAAKQEMESASAAPSSLIPSLPATDRLAIYTESDERFHNLLASETRIMRTVDKVALQSMFLGPPIGALLCSQGILGTYGYYKYTTRPRPQLEQAYKGSIVGATGIGITVVANAAALLASVAYENHLAKEHRLPRQLIEQRLQHISDVEKIVSAM